MTKPPKKKLKLHKNTVFLGLIKRYRIYEFGSYHLRQPKYKNSITMSSFKNHYSTLYNIFYVFDLLKSWRFLNVLNLVRSYNVIQYYALNSQSIYWSELAFYKNIGISKRNNIVIFSRPAKQIFLMFFKAKPIFIFTGGLMRIVMNEKRKSSKKLYKVAVSLIKLFSILLLKRNFFHRGFVKLINIGSLRAKIIKNISKLKASKKISHVIIEFRIDFTSQKLETRRAIKKYVKKRFKVR